MDALQSPHAVLIPAEDGGYALIGLSRAMPGVFERIDWSTDRMAARIRDRLREAGARWAEPTMLSDVDEPGDRSR